MKYKIKRKIVQDPEIELPEDSKVGSIKYSGAYEFIDGGLKVPEMWEVVWLEPVKKGGR